MNVRVIQPPAALVAMDVVKRHLVVDHADDDVLIEAYLAAVCAHIDGPDGWLDRAIGLQTLELTLDDFCGGAVRLPLPPAAEVQAITYIDADGVEQAMDDEAWVLVGIASNRPTIEPAYGATWPTPRASRGAVKITYRAGYQTTPPAIVAAVLLMVGDLYANRETVAPGGVAAIPMSASAARLLAPLRVHSI